MNAASHGAELLNDIGSETEQFQRHRLHLEAVAYRMLGSVSEAEDALQEAWLRLSRSQQETIHNARALQQELNGAEIGRAPRRERV
jgi:hypothetical protein